MRTDEDVVFDMALNGTPGAGWCFVTTTHDSRRTVVRIRRVRDASVVLEVGVPDGMIVDELRVSKFDDTIVILDRSRREIAWMSLAAGRWSRRSLPTPWDALIDIAGDGSIACGSTAPEKSRSVLVAFGEDASPYELQNVTAIVPGTDGFVAAVATTTTHRMIHRLRIHASGRFELRDDFEFDGGESYPLFLGLAIGTASEVVTQVVEGQGPPWIVVVAPERPPRRITRAWFGREQAVVRDGVLYHFAGFGQTELLRLELSEGAACTNVLGGSRVVTISPDAKLAMVRLPESEVLDGTRVGLVHALIDVETGERQSRVVLEAFETLHRWMIR